MAVPFESDLTSTAASLLHPDTRGVVELLHRVAGDLVRLEHSAFGDGMETLRLDAASRAVHLALVELEGAI